MKKNILVTPVLKWVGGKRQLIADIEPLIPKKISTYVEPFVGGAAILFHIQPKKAIINDFNKELMNVYEVIKDNPSRLIDILEKHKKENSENYYYETRSMDRTSTYEQLSIEEIKEVSKMITDSEVISDEMNKGERIPFIQADNFERIISLLENMYENPMTGEEIEDLMQFTSRQRDYYFNAGKYLGLFEKINEDKVKKYRLTKNGIKVFKKNYKERQLELVRLILSHRIFRDLFEETIISGCVPERSRVIELELQYNVCSSNVASRRASSVISWLNWIFNLINL